MKESKCTICTSIASLSKIKVKKERSENREFLGLVFFVNLPGCFYLGDIDFNSVL